MCSDDHCNFSVQNNGFIISQTAQTGTEPIAWYLGRQVQTIELNRLPVLSRQVSVNTQALTRNVRITDCAKAFLEL